MLTMLLTMLPLAHLALMFVQFLNLATLVRLGYEEERAGRDNSIIFRIWTAVPI